MNEPDVMTHRPTEIVPTPGSPVQSEALLERLRAHVDKMPVHDCHNSPCWFCELHCIVDSLSGLSREVGPLEVITWMRRQT